MAEKESQINLEKANINEFSIDKREFIEKYGLDNIIALDKETNGIFSRKIFDNDAKGDGVKMATNFVAILTPSPLAIFLRPTNHPLIHE